MNYRRAIGDSGRIESQPSGLQDPRLGYCALRCSPAPRHLLRWQQITRRSSGWMATRFHLATPELHKLRNSPLKHMRNPCFLVLVFGNFIVYRLDQGVDGTSTDDGSISVICVCVRKQCARHHIVAVSLQRQQHAHCIAQKRHHDRCSNPDEIG